MLNDDWRFIPAKDIIKSCRRKMKIMEKTLSSKDHTFANLVELFKQEKFTEVLRIAKPMIDQNPNEINLINISGAAAAITG